MTPTTLWLIAGVACFAAEAMGFTGIGLLFAGVGALTTAIVLELGLVTADSTLVQFVWFSAATAIAAALLWKPLQKFRISRSGGGFNNMIGDTAVIGAGGLAKNMPGEATWSGTVMKAELATDAGVESLVAGAQAVIIDVRGATLIVKPK